jgi:hypothetical protein
MDSRDAYVGDLIGHKAASDDASRVLIERRLEAIE